MKNRPSHGKKTSQNSRSTTSQSSRQGRASNRPSGRGTHPTKGMSPQRGNPRREGGAPLRDKARWVVGIHSCHETLRVRPRSIRELWLREDFASSQQLRELADSAESARIPVRTRSMGQLDDIGGGHQGVALAVLESPALDWEWLAEPGPRILVVLDGIEDPHNLGSILRTGWLSGVSGVLIPEDRAVGLTPAVCKVASGGAEHVPVEGHVNLPSALLKLKEIGFWIYGLSEKGSRKPWEFELPEKVVWVIGSEGSGIRVPTERACDELVRIPQVSTGSSYNAAVAAAMALAETCRQFGKPE